MSAAAGGGPQPGVGRADFLARVRDRLAGGLPDNPARPIDASAAGAEVGYSADLTDRPAAFATALQAVMGHPRRVAASGAPGLLAEVVEVEGVKTAALTDEPECRGLGAVLADLGVEVVDHRDRDAVEACDLGVTGAAWGIALTGSVVVDSVRAGGRLVSLLPRVHLALLPVSRLLADPGDLFRHLDERLPDGLPSNLVLVTGPSRSADIELQITLGVHGPRSVWVGLLDD